MNVETFAGTLQIQFNYTTYVFGANLEGVGDADAVRRPAPGGNCVAWVAGHVLNSRAGLLGLLGRDAPFDAADYDRFRRGSPPLGGGEETLSLARMRADFAATAEPLRAGLAALTADALAAPAPFSPGNNPDETVGSLLAGLVFHEAYHVGQLGVLRRLAGAEGALS